MTEREALLLYYQLSKLIEANRSIKELLQKASGQTGIKLRNKKLANDRRIKEIRAELDESDYPSFYDVRDALEAENRKLVAELWEKRELSKEKAALLEWCQQAVFELREEDRKCEEQAKRWPYICD